MHVYMWAHKDGCYGPPQVTQCGVDYMDYGGRTPLMYAVLGNQPRMCEVGVTTSYCPSPSITTAVQLYHRSSPFPSTHTHTHTHMHTHTHTPHCSCSLAWMHCSNSLISPSSPPHTHTHTPHCSCSMAWEHCSASLISPSSPPYTHTCTSHCSFSLVWGHRSTSLITPVPLQSSGQPTNPN